MELQSPLYQTINGKNAIFNGILKKIFIDVEKMGAGSFHEIGHAINYNTNKIWKTVQLSRFAITSFLVPSIMIK